MFMFIHKLHDQCIYINTYIYTITKKISNQIFTYVAQIQKYEYNNVQQQHMHCHINKEDRMKNIYIEKPGAKAAFNIYAMHTAYYT